VLEWYDRPPSIMFHTKEVTTKFNHIPSKARGSVTLQEYQGFHMFSEIVLFFFDFLVTGGTYDS